MKTCIVCEGGAMRGIFTAGVLQAMLNQKFVADALVGVSAGASNGISYVSGQSERALRTNINYTQDKRYLSANNFIKTGSLFGMDFLFGTIPDELDPFDYNAFFHSKCEFFAGATNVETGKCEYFGKSDISKGFYPLRASCSLPVFSPMVEIHGNYYLDGGISNPIPLQKALQGQYDQILVVLTQTRSFRKKPMEVQNICKIKYHKYPKLLRAIRLRHLVYNHTLEYLHRLEKANRAIIIAPTEDLGIGRFEKNNEKLLSAYQHGMEQGNAALMKLR